MFNVCVCVCFKIVLCIILVILLPLNYFYKQVSQVLKIVQTQKINKY